MAFSSDKAAADNALNSGVMQHLFAWIRLSVRANVNETILRAWASNSDELIATVFFIITTPLLEAAAGRGTPEKQRPPRCKGGR